MMDLPGGAPQGCFLGAIIFIVKFNGALMRPSIPRPKLSLSKPSEIKLKYFDDATAAVSLQLDSVLKSDPKMRQRPFTFSERFQKVLPSEQNILQQQLINMEDFSTKNRMIINKEKTKAMKFTRVTKVDFPLELNFEDGDLLEVLDEIKLLGVIVQDNLKWNRNTDYICKKARQRIWLIRNMRKSGLSQKELVDAYTKEVRSLLELAVPVWHSSLTAQESHQIERVQKSALSAILCNSDISYSTALKVTKLETLSSRREKMCLKFITKNMKTTSPLLTVNKKAYNTKDSSKLVKEYQCRTSQYFKSALPYLARLVNGNY